MKLPKDKILIGSNYNLLSYLIRYLRIKELFRA